MRHFKYSDLGERNSNSLYNFAIKEMYTENERRRNKKITANFLPFITNVVIIAFN